jgi:hypothetical protein
MVADCTLLGNVPGVSGSGTLATITFNVKGAGESPLTLWDVALLNSLEHSITTQVVSGYATCARTFFVEGPYHTWLGAEYWIIVFNGRRPIRLISSY